MVVPRAPLRRPKTASAKSGTSANAQNSRGGQGIEMGPTEAEALLKGYMKSVASTHGDDAPTPQDPPCNGSHGAKKKRRTTVSKQQQQQVGSGQQVSVNRDGSTDITQGHRDLHGRRSDKYPGKHSRDEDHKEIQHEQEDTNAYSGAQQADDDSGGGNNGDNKEDEDQEPDWGAIAEDGPARSDAPIFLDARDRLKAANDQFAAALDEIHGALKQSIDDLLTTAANIHNIQQEKLDALEADLKHNFVSNHEARQEMQKKLEESAKNAQGLFAQLLMRVSQPLQSAASQLNTGMNEQHEGNNVTENAVKSSQET